MKLTPHKLQWINNRTTHYCKLLQVEIPILILKRKDHEVWKQKRQEERRLRYMRLGCYSVPPKYMRGGRSSKFLGVCYRESKVIYLNVKRHCTLMGLDNTLRHELIHLAKPSYNHRSFDFYDRMCRLKKGKITNGRFN